MNRNIAQTVSIRRALQLFQAIARSGSASTGELFVGNGNIDVGTKTPARKTDGPSALRTFETKPLSRERPRICVAMAQQSGDSGRGNQSAPQELLQLVGCRDPKARPVPWVRPHTDPAKR
jgi:hypothetical protein